MLVQNQRVFLTLTVLFFLERDFPEGEIIRFTRTPRNPVNPQVRLKSRGRTDVGILEILHEDSWVEVCDEHWKDVDAKVLCREMGYRDGKALHHSTLGELHSSSIQNKSITRVRCTGQEHSLLECAFTVNTAKCRADQRASAICYNTSVSRSQIDEFAVRLGNGTGTPYWGEVNVRHMGVWGQICSNKWNDVAANIVCKQLKFTGGRAYGTVNETFMPVWITSLNCTGSETSLDQCVHGQWGQPIRPCKPAYALCYRTAVNVTFVGGGIYVLDAYHGRVQISHDGQKGSICDDDWSKTDARVVCNELGFADGQPMWKVYKYYMDTGPIMMTGLLCSGQETSILQCKNNGWMTYNGTNCETAAVLCYTHEDMRLEGGANGFENISGRVSVKQGIWGRVSTNAWDDKDATVVCRTMGYKGGVAFKYPSTSGPYMLGKVDCHGNETSLFDCPVSPDPFPLGDAGVLCYQKSKPWVNVTGSYSPFTGRLEVVMDGTVVGTICNTNWYRDSARVACRQVGFEDGDIVSHFPSPPNTTVVMSNVMCAGSESSIFMCRNPGWRNKIDERCLEENSNAAVVCYKSVRIVDGQSTENTTAGRVEIYRKGYWFTVCATNFGLNEAKVVCRELGYLYFNTMYPRTFGTKRFYGSAVGITNCSGYETSLSRCSKTDSYCYAKFNNYASVICSRDVIDTESDIRVLEFNSFPATVFVEKYGMKGFICGFGWDDSDANIVCTEQGYTGGVAFVPRLSISNSKIWMSNVACSGHEGRIQDCIFDETPSTECLSRPYVAQVLCYTGTVRLKSFGRTDVGNVEILYEDKWIEVCDEQWDDRDARVVCREMGHRDGKALHHSNLWELQSSSTQSKSVTRVRCTGREQSLLYCGFTVAMVKCRTYQRASAICFNTSVSRSQIGKFAVRLGNGTGNPYWGEVNVRHMGVWGQLCSSNWNDIAANIVCKQLNFTGGREYGTVKETFMQVWITSLNCTGSETSLDQCVHVQWGRPIRPCKPAYALCFRTAINVSLVGGGHLTLDAYYKQVQILHDGQKGWICDDDWSNNNAKVVCKQVGFTDGTSWKHGTYKSDVGTGSIMMTGVLCNSQETSILQCRNKGWMVHNETECKAAAVICSSAVRLSAGNSSYGVVQIFDQYKWTGLCGEGFTETDADVVCKQLGFEHGIPLPENFFGSVFQSGLRRPNISCIGYEGSVLDCPYDESRGCPGSFTWRRGSEHISHFGYAAVSCYSGSLNKENDMKLEGGTYGFENISGRVLVKQYAIWGRVSTNAWDDKDATVVCRTMGYKGGVAFKYTSTSGLYMLGKVGCHGNEASLFDCPVSPDPSPSGNAGVLCYKQ